MSLSIPNCSNAAVSRNQLVDTDECISTQSWICPSESRSEYVQAIIQKLQTSSQEHLPLYDKTLRIVGECFSRSALSSQVMGVLPPWCFSSWVAPSADFILKKVSPWSSTPYAQEKDLFAAARKEIFKDTRNVRVCLTTPDKVHLDAVIFKGTQKKAILFIPGTGGRYEDCAADGFCRRLLQFFKNYVGDISMMMVNYRGVAPSTGIPDPALLQIDIYTAYQYLIIHEGYSPEDVVIYCHSLGGLFGLQAASLIQQEYPTAKISAVMDRTFLDLSELVESYYGPLLGKIGKACINAFGANINNQEAANSLRGTLVAIATQGDTCISYEKASFVTQVAKQKLAKFQAIHLSDNKEIPDHHSRPFLVHEAQKVSKVIREILRIQK